MNNLIKAYFKTIKNRSEKMAKFLDKEALKPVGNAELQQLKSAARQGIAPLKKALQNYKWVSDPLGGVFDYVQPPWFTCARTKLKKQSGDCDDSARLLAEILKGTMYCILVIEGTGAAAVKNALKDPNKVGHWVFLDQQGNVFSDFSFEHSNVSDIKAIAHKYREHWTHIVAFDKKLNVMQIIE